MTPSAPGSHYNCTGVFHWGVSLRLKGSLPTVREIEAELATSSTGGARALKRNGERVGLARGNQGGIVLLFAPTPLPS